MGLGTYVIIAVLDKINKIGKRKVPDVMGIPINDAKKILKDSGFKVYAKAKKPSFFNRKLNIVHSQPWYVAKDEVVILEYFCEK